MDYTLSDSYVTHAVTGNRMHEDAQAIPTAVTADDMNMVIWSLMRVVSEAGLPPIAFNKDNPASYSQLLAACKKVFGTADVRLTYCKTGQPLPASNIGPIWHDDYESVMLWRVYSANGANYTGYASVDVGRVVWETQPTPRVGYVGSGASISRTTYAALRGWAIHNGVLVASSAWAAGTLLYKDNADGTTFTVSDVRGEFPRFWDAGRGVDAGRAFGSWAEASVLSGQLFGNNGAGAGNAWKSDQDVSRVGWEHEWQAQMASPVWGRLAETAPQGATGVLRHFGRARPRHTAGLATVKY